MAEKRFTVMIFLIAAFVFLSMYIAMWVYGIYVENTGYAKSTSKSSISCASQIFRLNNVHYAGNTLTFDIENEMGDRIPAIVIEADGASMEKEVGLDSGMMARVDVSGISINGRFKVYPKGCRDSNAKEYAI